MARYENTNIGYVSNHKLVKKYSTTTYLSVPEKNDDMYFISQEGDRCDALAQEFYKDSSLWWFIARVNNLKTNNIPAGTSLRIPVSTEKAKGF
jgi:6-phosphogluconolactonase (cycloisomerase 2 family)